MKVDCVCGRYNGVGYVSKYVTKSLVNSVEGKIDLSTVLLFPSNKRLFSMNDVRTRSMLDFTKEQVRLCEINGSAPLGLVESICREMNIDVGDFVVVEPDDNILTLYPDVFGYPYDGG